MSKILFGTTELQEFPCREKQPHEHRENYIFNQIKVAKDTTVTRNEERKTSLPQVKTVERIINLWMEFGTKIPPNKGMRERWNRRGCISSLELAERKKERTTDIQ